MLSKSQARTFFLGGTIITFVVFLGLSWTSLTKEVPKRTHEENLIVGIWQFFTNVGDICH